MASFGVVTSNAFELLGEDGGAKKGKPATNNNQQKKPQQATKPQPVASLNAGEALPSKRTDADRSHNTRRGRGGRVDHGTRGARGGRHESRLGAPGGRGGSNNGGHRPDKRASDRKSASGRGREQRKGGFGAAGAEGTWKDDLQAQVAEAAEAAPAADAAAAPADGAAPAEAAAEVAVEPVVETEEQIQAREEAEAQAKLISYAQFLEQKKAKLVESDLNKAIREVEIDESKFKAAKVAEKKKEVVPGHEDDKEEKDNKKKAAAAAAAAAAKKKGKVSLDEFVAKTASGPAAAAPVQPKDDNKGFQEQRPRSERGRGGRGGRGAGRGAGRGGRGGARAVFDDAAFPKLGAKA